MFFLLLYTFDTDTKRHRDMQGENFSMEKRQRGRNFKSISLHIAVASLQLKEKSFMRQMENKMVCRGSKKRKKRHFHTELALWPEFHDRSDGG